MINGLNLIEGLLGYFFFLALVLASLYNVYSRRVDDGLFGRVLYLATAFTGIAGLMSVYNGHVTPALLHTVLWLFLLRAIRNSIRSLLGDKHAIQR